ncbi:S41 family peptidase [Nonomuraea phyllanthi]|nr:S41 family peptidase [Nonomuraea phyllanthi]
MRGRPDGCLFHVRTRVGHGLRISRPWRGLHRRHGATPETGTADIGEHAPAGVLLRAGQLLQRPCDGCEGAAEERLRRLHPEPDATPRGPGRPQVARPDREPRHRLGRLRESPRRRRPRRPARRDHRLDPAAQPPMFITRVLPGSPAAKAGIRAGDIIVKANGVPAFIGDAVNQSILDAFASGTVRLTLKRPTTGRTRTVKLKEGPITRRPPAVTSKKLADGVTYVQLPLFYEGAADQVLAKLRGRPEVVVLDLRGNGGGSPREVMRLLGAFAHGKVTSYFCPLKGDCVPNRTDDSVPLLGSRLIVLTDRGCASACEGFSAAVKDNGLGTLIGTRTAGAISGPSKAYLLDDGSAVFLPGVRHLGPAREVIDTIGVPVDHYAPMTALDLATGRDPGVAKALALL